jgi:hypothetical protein
MSYWIKTEEKLPPSSTDILFYVHEYDAVLKGLFNVKNNQFKSEEGGNFYLSEITEWLPIPPREGERQ